jgi:hypothetical protein
MTVVSGTGFFRPTPGPTGQANAPRPAAAPNAVLQAQSAAGTGSRAEGADSRPGSPSRPAPAPFGPRGSIIDIVA